MASTQEAKPTRRLMLGNEAVAWGAIAAGVDFASGYPGTPSSEVLQTLIDTSEAYGHYAEWSTNEKVAVEAAAAASWAGKRSLAVMKHLGLNVAADALTTLAYTGIRGGLVIFSAGDAQCHTSSNELDARVFGRFAHLPVLDPCDPEEAFEFAKRAFELSERLELPVILNSTPRISHSSCALDTSFIDPVTHRETRFVEDKPRWICVAASALKRHHWLSRRLSETFDLLGDFDPVLRVGGGSKLGILTNGISHAYVEEAVAGLGIGDDVRLLKFAFSYPFDDRAVCDLALSVDRILVVEELEPVIEEQTRIALQKRGIGTPVGGKADGLLPFEGELDPGMVTGALAKALDLDVEVPEVRPAELPVRAPLFCPGCPHRSTYYGLGQTIRGMEVKPIIVGDIGCYTLVNSYPFEMLDTLLCMGGGAGMAHGFSQAGLDRPILAIMGDSTFFHSGLSPLANIGYHQANVTILLLDNQYTAMTGFQANPGTGLGPTGEPARRLSLEATARALGFDRIFAVAAHDSAAVKVALESAFGVQGPAMVISEGPCALQEGRHRAKSGEGRRPPLVVDEATCVGCKACLTTFGCSAIVWDPETRKAHIDRAKCIGCGDCVAVCPVGAIGGGRDA